MITLYYSLLIALAVSSLTALIVFARTRDYRKYLFILIPLFLVIVFKLIYLVDTIKSQPKQSLPQDYFYLHSIEIPQKIIYLWVVEKGKETPITVVIPWTQNNSKKLQDAKKSVAEGKMIAGKKKDKNSSQDDETGELLLYQFQLSDTFKK
jgi:hypothetical protein